MAKGKYQEWLTPDGITRLEAWARDGLTDEQIAHNMGICRDTLIEWKKKFPDISDALKRGKEVLDIEVENALLKRALGYDYTEERVEVSKENGKKTVKTTQTVKHVPPDTTAQIFWLKNRRPDRWRDKQQLEHSGSVDVNPYAGLTTEELRRLAGSDD
ncbi:helix-turn-helix domain-containing protein [uncultured Agathobaculum sp.]|uniref:helix-turn-helix domain-containing protein n=1 Tax=uncultured Agathobaculum sp. TaxID=2048140 RepID=UPI003208A375